LKYFNEVTPLFDGLNFMQVNADPSWALWENEQPALQVGRSFVLAM
jgi:hypothetical protein